MSAFSMVIQRTLAGAEGPDWTRLTPPPAPTPLREPAVKPYSPAPLAEHPPTATTSTPVPTATTRRGITGPQILAVTALGVGAVLVVQPWLQRAPEAVPPLAATVAVAPGPTAAALTAEAARRDADRAPDLVTADWATAEAWLDARGLRGLPDPSGLSGLSLVGVSLDHLDGTRVAVVGLDGPNGDFDVYFAPSGSMEAWAYGWADGSGLLALAGVWDGWQAVAVVGADATVPDPILQRLAAVARP